MTTFRRFRDTWLAKQEDGEGLIAEYYRIAPGIVRTINRKADRRAIYENIWHTYLKPCLTLIEEGKMNACKELYTKMVRNLQCKYAGKDKFNGGVS